MGMFVLGFISAFGVATVIVALWLKWDEWQQMKALDRENTALLLERVRCLEQAVYGGGVGLKAGSWAPSGYAKGGKRG